MSQSSWLVALVVVLSFGGGCACVQNRHQGCGDSCSANPDDPVLGDYNKCGVCGGNDCPGYTPCGYLKYMMTCGSGCSEIYWGEWISDPPDCCDPCDNCGNWTGAECGRRKPVLNTLKALWGERYFGGCCSTCGDSSCGGGCTSGPAHPVHSAHAIHHHPVAAPVEEENVEEGEEYETNDAPQQAEPVPARRAPAPPASQPEPSAARPRPTRTTRTPVKPTQRVNIQNASAAKSPWQPR